MTRRSGETPGAQRALQRSRATEEYDRAHASGGTAHETVDIHRLLVDSVRDYAIFALDSTGHILTWNAGARRSKGYAAEEIIGSHFSVFYPPEDVAAGKPERELREATRRGSIEDEGWRVRKDGSRFWANVVITALRDAAGELVGFAKVTRDVTERRRAEEDLRQSEERFRLLVTAVRDYAIFMLDPDGRVATWNEGAERIKGYTSQDIIGRHFSTFYPAAAIESQFPQYELKVAAEKGRFEDEGWRVRKDGSQFWANVVITALHDPAGRLFGFAKVTRDLTERREAEQRAIADARRLAEMDAANRAKLDFLGKVSHELRTPLNAIGGYSDLLTMGVPGSLNETQKQFIERIRKGQQHLLALVNDLLNFTRVEAGRLEYDIGPVPLRGVLDDLAALMLPQVEEKDVQFEIGVCPPNVTAWADAARVQQILLNLLSNAVKFTPAGGRVSVACSMTDDEVGITVLDTGPGIPADKQQAAFEPFVQLGRTLTTSHGGVGLGLSISRELARAMDGDLKLSSRVGEGSAFTLVLPRAGTVAARGDMG
ncbi:MAG TPA: PAS domain-containing sensor histidine kinase [Longimicrobiales bacterium]|nr:PAS domain-containing sensor histidine kinase [Longimicrobiales bacterium]